MLTSVERRLSPTSTRPGSARSSSMRSPPGSRPGRFCGDQHQARIDGRANRATRPRLSARPRSR